MLPLNLLIIVSRIAENASNCIIKEGFNPQYILIVISKTINDYDHSTHDHDDHKLVLDYL